MTRPGPLPKQPGSSRLAVGLAPRVRATSARDKSRGLNYSARRLRNG